MLISSPLSRIAHSGRTANNRSRQETSCDASRSNRASVSSVHPGLAQIPPVFQEFDFTLRLCRLFLFFKQPLVHSHEADVADRHAVEVPRGQESTARLTELVEG